MKSPKFKIEEIIMKGFLLIIFFLANVMCSQPVEKFPKSKIPFNPEKYVCYKTDAPIIIDGKMDEASWEKAAWTNYFVDIEGDLKPKPLYNTRVKMLWDETYFYFLGKLDE